MAGQGLGRMQKILFNNNPGPSGRQSSFLTNCKLHDFIKMTTRNLYLHVVVSCIYPLAWRESNTTCSKLFQPTCNKTTKLILPEIQLMII